MTTHKAAEPGQAGPDTADITRAQEATADARALVEAEQARLEVVEGAGVAGYVEQQRRLEDAQRDLDAAEAFEDALENGQL